MSIAKRLMDSTADIAAAVAARQAETPSPQSAPRTAPGQMIAVRGEILEMQSQLEDLRQKLAQHDGSLPTVKLDPKRVSATRWANRHETSFATPAFARLKSSIELAGGNTQPILVRRITENRAQFEVVFGHRRHRACLQLAIPVLAVIWDAPMNDLDLFLFMDRENREREDPSAYEQGVTYIAALEAQLFPSQRRLAEALGVSHTWVRKATAVAELPPAIIEAFQAPVEIQPKHAEILAKALEADRRGVLRRAEKLRQSAKRLSASGVVGYLTEIEATDNRPVKLSMASGAPIGSWKRDGKGRAVLTLEPSFSDDESVSVIAKALNDLALRRLET